MVGALGLLGGSGSPPVARKARTSLVRPQRTQGLPVKARCRHVVNSGKTPEIKADSGGISRQYARRPARVMFAIL